MAPRKKKPNKPATRCPRRIACLALLGSLGVGVGLFAPIVRVDFHGPVRLWDLADEERWLILAAALVCLHSVPAHRQRRLVAGAAFLWAALFFPAWEHHVIPDKRTWVERLADSVGRSCTDAATDIAFSFDLVHFEWGLGALIGGGVLLTFAGLLALRGPRR